MTSRIIAQSIRANLFSGGAIARCYVDNDSDLVQRGDGIRVSDVSGDNTYLIGYTLDDINTSLSALRAITRFNIATPQAHLTGRLQAIGFTEQASPSNDHQIAPDMTFGDMVEHILVAHTNLIYDATSMPDGVVLSTNIDKSDAEIDRYNVRASNNLWQTITGQLSGQNSNIQFYMPYFDKFGDFHYQPSPHFSAPATQGELNRTNILAPMQVTTHSRNVGQVEIAGIANGDTLYTSIHPSSPTDGTIHQISQGIYVTDQTMLNDFAEGLYGWLSRPYTVRVEVRPEIVLYDGLDIANRVDITYDGPAEDAIFGNGFHLDWSTQGFIVYGYEVEFDIPRNSARCWLDLEAL